MLPPTDGISVEIGIRVDAESLDRLDSAQTRALLNGIGEVLTAEERDRPTPPESETGEGS